MDPYTGKVTGGGLEEATRVHTSKSDIILTRLGAHNDLLELARYLEARLGRATGPPRPGLGSALCRVATIRLLAYSTPPARSSPTP